MDKPKPYTEKKEVMDFMDMIHWIDEKYQINQRDYKGKYSKEGSYRGFLESRGFTHEEIEAYGKRKPADMSPEWAAIKPQVRQHQDEWAAAHPYCDFWHFQIEKIYRFQNDTHIRYPLTDIMEGAEDWQKEIAQLWVDEFGEFADDDGEIYCWVSW